jgi:L-Ala-D/L-Glu epimerase
MSVTKNTAQLKLSVAVEKWPLKAPFRITGHTFTELDVVVVSVERNGHIGRGEAAGVYYLDDTVPGIVRRIEAARAAVEAGIDRDSLRRVLPAGGARNAVDCALWDLEAQTTGQPAWKIAGVNSPVPLVTTYTLGANDPEQMAAGARGYVGARAIKLKLTGEPVDAERVREVRKARPDVWLGVDANQGFTRQSLELLMPTLIDSNVQLIEQPFPVGREAELDGLHSPIPLAADESVQDLGDVPDLVGRFQVMNIKLDKSGGLTEALAMAQEARRLGLELMVGNMTGTVLSMAPAFVVGQLCRIVDLDGPIFLREDRSPGTLYEDGKVWCPPQAWGGGAA